MKKLIFFVFLFAFFSFCLFAEKSIKVSNIRVSDGNKSSQNTWANGFKLSFDRPTKTDKYLYFYYIAYDDVNCDDCYFDAQGYYQSLYGPNTTYSSPSIIDCVLSYSQVTGNVNNQYGKGIKIYEGRLYSLDDGKRITDKLLSHGYISGNSFRIQVPDNKIPVTNKITVIIFSYYFSPGDNYQAGFRYDYIKTTVPIDTDKPTFENNEIKVFTDMTTVGPDVYGASPDGNGFYNVAKYVRDNKDLTTIWISAKASDLSGILKYSVVINNKSQIINGSDFNKEAFLVPDDGLNEFKLFAYDSWNNKSQPYTINVYKDSEIPSGIIKVENAEEFVENEKKFYAGRDKIKLTLDCDFNLVKNYNWKIKDLDTNQTIRESTEDIKIEKNQDALINREGRYQVSAELIKESGLKSYTEPVTVIIDRYCEKAEKLILSYDCNLTKNISGIKVKPYFTGSETKYYEIEYFVSKNEGEYQFAGRIKSSLLTETVKIQLENINMERNVRNSIKAVCYAYDFLNNKSEPYEVVIVIPAKLRISSVDSKYDQEEKNIVNKIYFENRDYELSDYEELYLRNDKDDIVKIYRVDEVNSSFITDKIEKEFGHGYLNYLVSGKIKGTDIVEEETESEEIMVSNVPGKLFFKIKEREEENSEFIGIWEEGDKVFQNSELKIKKDCKVFVSYRGKEADNDIWNMRVNRIYKNNGVECRNSLYQGNGFEEKNIPVLLNLGENNLVFEWDEVNERGDKVSNKSEIYSIKVTENYGNSDYSIIISEGMMTGEGEIITRPGEVLSFSISEGLIADWDFGDGTVEKKNSVNHYYLQKENQDSDTAEYIIKVKAENMSLIEIPVYVKDTQQGSLLVDEIWRGPHKITGTVIVPEGKVLKIENKLNGSGSEIIFENVSDTNSAKIEVEGSLEVSGKERNKFTAVEKGCEGIVVGGKADIKSSDFIDFDRAVVIVSKGEMKTRIQNCDFTKNNIGIHVFGNVFLKNISLKENSEYGIKEEAGCRVESNQLFDKESGDYYKFR